MPPPKAKKIGPQAEAMRGLLEQVKDRAYELEVKRKHLLALLDLGARIHTIAARSKRGTETTEYDEAHKIVHYFYQIFGWD